MPINGHKVNVAPRSCVEEGEAAHSLSPNALSTRLRASSAALMTAILGFNIYIKAERALPCIFLT